MPCSISITYEKEGVEQKKVLSATELRSFDCIPTANNVQELQSIYFRDGSAIHSFDGKPPLQYAELVPCEKEGSILFKEGYPIINIVIDLPKTGIYRSTLHDSYRYLIRFIQNLGIFYSKTSQGSSLYHDSWIVGIHTEEKLDTYFETYGMRFDERECVGCGEDMTIGVGDYCAECWTQVHM